MTAQKFKALSGNISAKRQSTSEDHPNKRQKTDEPDAAISNVSTIPARNATDSKGNRRNILIKLHGPLPKVEKSTYLNPAVLKLFGEVKVPP